MEAKEKETRKSRQDKVPVLGPPSDRSEEFLRLMDAYEEIVSRRMVPMLHLPMFPYWRDVGISTPSADVIDYGDKFVVRVEFPGFEKEDIDVQVSGFSLEITADQNSTIELDEKKKSVKSRVYVRRERRHGTYRKAIQFPQEVTPLGAKALLKNGLLEVEVPKIVKSSEKPTKVSVL